MNTLKGTITALITPFKADGAVDYDGFRSLIRIQLSNGISGLLPLGTTGETPTLERDEQDALIRIAVEEAAGKVPVMVGTGSNSTFHTIENTKEAKKLGADIALVVTPYYNKPSDEGIYQHFKAVAREGGLPVMVYNIAGRTGRNISTPLMKRIALIPGIVGVKEASGDVNQVMDVISSIASKNPDFAVFSGDDALALPIMALGGRGVISVVSNLAPRRMADLSEAALSGDFVKAREIHYSLLPIFRAAFIEANPAPIKAAMNIRGMPSGSLRLPMVGVLPENEVKIRQALEESGL